ncbi:Tryptophan synthase alpha chain [Buchnera aphidicola (Cinara piceae)]|uniref:Tryptophan synthase alpha chain n=1 Tax=Buchnera aphidicola (Cinara piceae) TaxID=1660043 RepID=A0A803FTU9_9GAMM|nr:tryptophan synthase subunit alpha [Buchnera aphidicola]VFP88265.1 Tryptophan synthase alpha chain [Buchnera aphidicola (Cinara piceae)]
MKSRYTSLFQNLSLNKECCFIPFIVLGDPSINISLEIIDILITNGADALELGIPFSDPIADGVVIQNSHIRALNNNITIKQCFDIIFNIRKKYPNIPIGLLTYSNIIFCQKLPVFYSLCRSIEIDSVLIADLPIEESYIFRKIANKNNISSIFICPHDANKKFIKRIAAVCKSYIYLVSRPGITGIQAVYPQKLLINIIKKLKKYNSPPIIQGFGIYKASQIKNIINSGVQGIICGSRIIKIIENNLFNKNKMFKKIAKIVKIFKKETIY